MSWNPRDFKRWTEQTIAEVDIGDLHAIDKLLSMPAQAVRAKSFDEVHDMITLLAQYGVFLTDQLNRHRASAKYYEKEFKERLSAVMAAGGVNGKSREEREMSAIQIDDQLRELNDKMKEQKLKAERIEGLPYVIGTYIGIVNEIYRLKINEKKYGSKKTKEE